MALHLTINGVDYSKYIVPTTQLTLDDKLNLSKTLSFSVYPADASFAIVTANQRVRLFDDTRVVYTGYVTATPKKTNVVTGFSGYNVVASSDEWLFSNAINSQNVTYVGLTVGTILINLVNLFGGTGIDFSKTPQGPIVPQFIVQAGWTFTQAAQALGQKTGWRWAIVDSVLTLTPQNDKPYGYDINANSGNFNIANLNLLRSNVSIVNDITAFGAPEPTSYVNDNFVGDGNTTLFNLFAQPFGIGSSNVVFSDSFTSSALNTSVWTLQDPANLVSYQRKNITVSGGTTNIGDTVLFTKDPFEIGGEITFDFGTYTFSDLSLGILGGIYTDNKFALSSCFAGVWVTGNTARTGLQPFLNGAPQSGVLVTQVNHAYELRVHVSADEIYRFHDIFRSITGQFGGGIVNCGGYVTIEVLDYDLTNPNLAPVSNILLDTRVASIPAFGTVGLLNCSNLFATAIDGPKVTQHDPVRVRHSTGRVSSWSVNQNNGVWQLSIGQPPVLNDTIFVHYRGIGNIQSRLKNNTNITTNGLKAATLSLPTSVRSSADCENLLQAYLSDHASVLFEGTYSQNGVALVDVPTAGRNLNLTLPSVSVQPFVSVVREAVTAITDMQNEICNVVTTFGFAPLMAAYTTTNVAGTITANDVNSLPLFLDDDAGFQTPTITGTTINADGSRTPSGKFQVRTDNINWGVSSGGDFVGDFVTQTFALNRTSRSNVFFVREVNGSKFSRNSSILLATGYPIQPASPLGTSNITVGLNVTYAINLGVLTDVDSVLIIAPNGTTQIFSQKIDPTTVAAQTNPQVSFTTINVDFNSVVNQRNYTNYQFYTVNFRGERSIVQTISGSLPTPAAPNILVGTINGEVASFVLNTEARTDITQEILEVATDAAFTNIVATDNEDQQFGSSTVDVPAIGTYFVRARKSDVIGFGSNSPLSENLFTFGSQFDNAIWTQLLLGGASSATITPNATADPTGNITADKIVFPATGPTQSTRLAQAVTIPVPSVGSNYVMSIWLRADVASTVFIFLKKDNAGGQTVGNTTVCNLTTQWQEFTTTGDASSNASTVLVGVLSPVSSSPGVTLYAWGAQIEPGTTATQTLLTGSTNFSSPTPQTFAVTTVSTVDKNTPNPPTTILAPTQAIVKSADGTLVENVTLTWAAPATIPPAVTGYLIRYKVSTATVYTYNRVGNVTTATIHGLLLNTTYNFSVASMGEVSQQSAFPTDINVTTNNNAVAPSTVGGLTAIGAFREIALTWTAVTDSDLSFYQISWAPDISGTPGTFQVIAKANTNLYNDKGDSARGQLAVSTAYWYKVQAVNSTGNVGTASANVTATTTPVAIDSDVADGTNYLRSKIEVVPMSDLPYNGGFEIFADTKTVAEGWTINYETTGSGATFSRSTSPFTGSFAQTITPVNTASGAAVASRHFGVKAGAKYTFSCRAKSTAANPANMYFRIYWFNSDADLSRASANNFASNDVVSAGGPTVANTYQSFSAEFIAPVTAVFARIAIYAWIGNTAALTVDTVVARLSTLDLDNAVIDGSSRFAGMQAGAMGDGFQILSNTDFAGGLTTGYSVYDNNVTGNVTFSTIADTAAPNSSGWKMRITVAAGGENPGFGGFTRTVGPDSGAFVVNTYHRGSTIVWRIRANIPVGYQLNQASNATGTPTNFIWITNQAGTGSFFEYVATQLIGTSGTFSSTGFYYITGPSAPFTWDVAMCSAVCATHPAGFGIIDIDPNRRANVDFTQTSHIGKIIDNINDGTTFGRVLNTALTSNAIDPAKAGFRTKGSTPVTVSTSNPFSYASTTSSITLSWVTIGILRADGTQTTISASSQAVTGLLTAQAYNFFPYWDEALGTMVFMTRAGANGSPAIAYTVPDPVNIQLQNLQGHIPLGTVTASTTSSGTSSGSGGGGSPNGCLWYKCVVLHKDKGVVPLSDCQIGDWIMGKAGRWTQIEALEIQPCEEWISTTFENGESLFSTTGHPTPLIDGTISRACNIGLGTYIPACTLQDGVFVAEMATSPTEIKLVKTSDFIAYMVCDHEHDERCPEICGDGHLFYAGMKEPIILTHNGIVPSL